MDKVTGQLLIFFEEPFWVGVFEHTEEGRLSVCKVVFGAEPKGIEVCNFILEDYCSLRFSTSVESIIVEKNKINPKRLQRDVKRQIETVGIGTKSQQALQLQQQQGKLERKKRSREKKEAEQQFQFELKQQKRKEKHRGR